MKTHPALFGFVYNTMGQNTWFQNIRLNQALAFIHTTTFFTTATVFQKSYTHGNGFVWTKTVFLAVSVVVCEGFWIGELTALRYLAGIFDNVRISLVIPSLTVQIEVVDVHILTKRGLVFSTAFLLLNVTQNFWICVFLLECLWWLKKCSNFTCCFISDMLPTYPPHRYDKWEDNC